MLARLICIGCSVARPTHLLFSCRSIALDLGEVVLQDKKMLKFPYYLVDGQIFSVRGFVRG